MRRSRQLHVPGLDRCRVAFDLDDGSRPVIAAFKYRRQRRIAQWFAAELANLVPRCADVITWIPATPERRRTRGFDQAQELARALSLVTGVPAVGLLSRDRSDHRQTGRTRQERMAGPALRPLLPAPPFVVLIDDVITTGSSMRTAAGVIRSTQQEFPGAASAAETQRIVGVAVAATPDQRDVCLHPLTNGSSIRQWT